MLSIIQSIHDFNSRAGLLNQPYNDFLESSFQIEEALEGFNIFPLAERFGCDPDPKTMARAFMTEVDGELADVDRLDKHLDSIVYNFGSIFKLGLTPQQAIKALSIVADANLQKLSAGQDSEGKQMKPEGFIPPEGKLQKILDEVANASPANAI